MEWRFALQVCVAQLHTHCQELGREFGTLRMKHNLIHVRGYTRK